MKVALYKGLSSMSRAIRWKTWSEFSHAAWVDNDDTVIEAWTPGGVRRVANIGERHARGTEVWLFTVPDATKSIIRRQREFLNGEIGKPYDWAGIMGFVRRRETQNREKWFCSELVFEAFLRFDLPLLKRIDSHKVYPALLAYSPLLHFDTVVTI